MPSRSNKQARYMAACAYNPESVEGDCPPKSVAKKYVRADKKSGRLKKANKRKR